MSTNIQVPNYPQQIQGSQQVIQQPAQLQPHEVMGGHYNPHAQNTQNVQQTQNVVPHAQQVHYDNYNQIIPNENASKSVTFIADAISLQIMKDCDNIHINTLINMGIKLAKDHSFYKQFLVNKENYVTTNTEECNFPTVTPKSSGSVGVGNSNNGMVMTPTAAVTTTPAPTNNELDFSKMFG